MPHGVCADAHGVCRKLVRASGCWQCLPVSAAHPLECWGSRSVLVVRSARVALKIIGTGWGVREW
jgi:hypothetical protein